MPQGDTSLSHAGKKNIFPCCAYRHYANHINRGMPITRRAFLWPGRVAANSLRSDSHSAQRDHTAKQHPTFPSRISLRVHLLIKQRLLGLTLPVRWAADRARPRHCETPFW
jgi:hypothetical protein